MVRKQAMGITDMKFHSRKVALFSQGSIHTKSRERKFSESSLKLLLAVPTFKAVLLICATEAQ